MKIFPINSYYKKILTTALPAIAGLSTQMVVSLVDAGMVGRLNNAEFALAAMGIGVLATWALISFFSSLATGTHVLTAHRFGSNKFNECSVVLNNSLLIGFIIGVIVTSSALAFADEIGNFFSADPKVGEYAGEYIFYRFLGIPFFLMSVSYRGFFFGINRTKIFMFSGILTNFFNIIFNYIFIYGEFGLPAMGLAGAGIGSSIATVFDFSFYLFISQRKVFNNKFNFFKNFKIDWNIIRSMYRISLPVSLQNIFILIGFLSFVAIIGLIGTIEQAATQAVISTLFISILPSFGFGIAAQTLVGNNLGSRKIILSKIYGFETAKIATYYTLFLGIIFILIPDFVLLLITTDKSIIEVAIPIMRIAGFSQIFYSSGIVLANGLQAAGKTTFVMYAEVITNLFIFIPLAYLVGVYFEFGLIGAWLCLPIYILSYSSIIYYKFRFGKWENKNL